MDTMPTYETRYNRVAGSGMRRSNPNRAQMAPGQTTPSYASTAAPSYLSASFSPAAPMPYANATNPTSVGSQVGAFQNYAQQGVQGFGDIAGQDFRKNVGEMLGNLNSIGALRSGATVSGINDLTTNYGRQIGDYAKQATLGAITAGQSQANLESERQYRAQAEARARKHSTLGTIGKLVGGIGGLVLPGTAGKIAEKIGGALG